MPDAAAPAPDDAFHPRVLHASTVALDGRAALILGPSGSGKSALALTLMALGAALIADDRTVLTRQGAKVVASAPETIRGKIEARGIGLLAAEPADPAPVVLAIDLDRTETERMPPVRHLDLLGVGVDLLHKSASAHFAPAVLQYLRRGRAAPEA